MIRDNSLLNSLNVNKNNVLPTEILVVERNRDLKQINQLLAEGYSIQFSKHDNYITINGKTFNGFGRKEFNVHNSD